jgi:tRNA (guanine37-N1)-methyltransferase
MSDPTTPKKSHGRLSIRATATPRDLMEEPRLVKGAWVAKVITLFPEAFPGTLGLSLTGKALDTGLWRLDAIDLRTFGEGKHRNVDDTPAGGGAGMVLRPDVVDAALRHARVGTPIDRGRWPVIYLSPRGRPFDQATARRLASGDGLTLLCGRFEGVDQRVLDHHQVEELSLGDFVLTGGEIAAQADGLLEHPQFTRPAVWEGREIPAVLQSGNHAEIARWRRAEAEALTIARRPDLWDKRRS